MKFDEIGQTIVDEELTGVLTNLLWKVSQSYLVINKQGEKVEIPVTAANNQYVKTNESYLTLVNQQEKTLADLKQDLKLRNQFLRINLPDKRLLWPLASQKGGTEIEIRIPETLFIELYHRKFNKYKIDYVDFRNQVYLKIAQGFELVSYLLTYLTAATPFQWDATGNDNGRPRRSYHTRELLQDIQSNVADFRTLKGYLASINQTGKIKFIGNLDQHQGIEGLKITDLDFNPDTRLAIGSNILELINVITGYFLMNQGIENENLAAKLSEARTKDYEIASENPFKHSKYEQEMRNLLEDLNHFASKMGYGTTWNNAYQVLHAKIDDVMETPAARLLRQEGGMRSFEFVKHLAEKEKTLSPESNQLSDNSIRVLNAAFVAGMDYQVVSAEKDILQINHHFVKNGIQNDLGNAVLADVWEDKAVAKQLVSGLKINTQQAWKVKNLEQANRLYPLIKNKAVVIKNADGHTTKVGSLFRLAPSKREFTESISDLLKQTDEVMIEQVISGSAYQAMLLNGKIVSLIERIPENVVGDGRSKIGELIEKKKLPLEKNEHRTLVAQGIQLDQVAPRGIQTLLRYDAFSTTKFESYDALDEVDESYLQLIEKIAQKLKMQDGFIDVIIDNIYQPYTEAHPELMTFLSAHAAAALAKHEELLLNQHRDLARLVIEKLKDAEDQ